jgi:hypothetical protein
MKKVIDEKKTSSRVRFMLQDVIELRQVIISKFSMTGQEKGDHMHGFDCMFKRCVMFSGVWG